MSSRPASPPPPPPSEPHDAPQPPGPPVQPVAADPDALPRPEEEVAGVRDAGPDVPAVAGGTDDGRPAQGEGAPDSW